MNKMNVCIAPDFLTLTAMCGELNINLEYKCIIYKVRMVMKNPRGSNCRPPLSGRSGQEITINKLLGCFATLHIARTVGDWLALSKTLSKV